VNPAAFNSCRAVSTDRCGCGYRLVSPQLVSRAHISPERRAARSVNKVYDRVAIDRRRHGLAKLEILEPDLLLGDAIQFLPRQVILIED